MVHFAHICAYGVETVKQPQKGQNEPFGLLNFISKDTLKNELGENPVLSMNCLILPFSKSFTSLKLRQPSLVSMRSIKLIVFLPDPE